MASDPLPKLRKICLALPEATEQETWGHPTFRVRNKIFATYGEGTMTCKAPPGEQDMLLQAGDRFFYPSYVGSKGWIGLTLAGKVDWTEVQELVEDSYREIAPKKLSRELD